MGQIVRRRFDRLGIVGGRRGPHSLRHAAAQHLLDQGMSMKVIGDFLGHRSLSSTAMYAKIDLNALREVADFDLEDLDMTLKDSIDRYIAWRKAHGARFRTDSIMLRLFVKRIDGEINCDAVTGEQVCAFLAGAGYFNPVPRQQVQRIGWLLPLRDQPRLCELFTAPGQ